GKVRFARCDSHPMRLLKSVAAVGFHHCVTVLCVYLSVFLRQLFASSIVVGLGKGTILEGGYANSSQQSRFRTTTRDEVCRKLQRMAISGHSHPRRIRPVQQRMKISRQAVKQTTEHLATHPADFEIVSIRK